MILTAMALMCHCFVFSSCTSAPPTAEPKVPPAWKEGAKPPDRDIEDSARLMERGRKYFDEGNMQPGLFEFVRAAELNPNSSEAYLYIARICRKTGKNTQASESYDIALKINPEDNGITGEYADFLRMSGDNEKAAKLYAKLVDGGDADLKTRINFASSLARAGKQAEAEKAFTGAINAYPDNTDALRAFAGYWFERADESPAAAADCYEKAAVLYEKASQIEKTESSKWMFRFLQAQSFYRKWLVTKSDSDRKKASMIFDGYENCQDELPWKMSARYFLSVLNEND
ncbi:MAG: tetratricopeptide repeat protein [Firmicutes bacterium]|nr:tetratricopeptide repeat protein [Bacillota bacterium]